MNFKRFESYLKINTNQFARILNLFKSKKKKMQGEMFGCFLTEKVSKDENSPPSLPKDVEAILLG